MCRICGDLMREDILPHQNKRNFVEEIQDMYEVDVSNEDDSIYPTYICRAHCSLLYRFRNHDKNTSFETSVTGLYKFAPHVDINCCVCTTVINDHGHDYVRESNRGRPRKRKYQNNRDKDRLRIEYQENKSMYTIT